jgi:hypothetical protein
MSDYILTPIDLTANGIAQTANLLTAVFGASTQFTPEFVDWEYNKNPVGTAVGFNAWAGNELAAHYVTQPIVAHLNGKKTKGLLSLNSATHENHRGKRLFTLLAEKTFELGLASGYEFVIGVANANSTPGFLKHLGFTLVAPLEVKFGLGTPDVTLTTDYEYARDWDKDLLAWRINNPKLQYVVKMKKDHFTVLAPTGKFGIHAVLGTFPLELLPENIQLKTSTGLNPLSIWMGMDEPLSWKRKPYFPFPNSLKPSPLNLIFRDLTDLGRMPKSNQIKFLSLDFDAY